MFYGGFDLRRGDRDSDGVRVAVWGGAAADASSIDGPSHVEQLQNDLDHLGFDVVGGADGQAGRKTQWAIREFQIYAGMERVAREIAGHASHRYVDRLEAVETGASRYTGPISGVLNEETRALLGHWLASAWRCPVVVEAWSMSSGRRHSLKASNIWLHDELKSSQPRVYVRDFSGYYDLPPGRRQSDMVVAGDFVTFDQWSGPRSVPSRHTWGAQSELTPANLIGREHEELRTDQLSTFKVVRAVSEVECLGFFDSVNSYDNAFVSVGPCHWTLGIADRNGGVDAGEMCGFLAYLERFFPDAYRKAFGDFGAGIQAHWGEDGAALFKSTQRKYSEWVTLENESGGHSDLARSEAEGDYFKTWHWFYRFLMAGRTVDGYRHAMWDMARIRLRDLTATPWPDGVSSVMEGPMSSRPPQLGDVFTSEKALGILLRWHIRYPADVVRSGNSGPKLLAALATAKGRRTDLNWERDPSTWTDSHERALLDGLRAEVERRGNENLSQTIDQVDNWPTWRSHNPRGYTLSNRIFSLSEERGSFRFDDSGLPAAPAG